MATTATGTLLAGVQPSGGGLYKGIFELVLDTTDANGEMTLDITSYFSKVYAVSIGGSDATTGYVVEVEKPAYDAALSATNLKLGFYEAGADGAPLDPVASTDFSALITGLTVVVEGKAKGNAT